MDGLCSLPAGSPSTCLGLCAPGFLVSAAGGCEVAYSVTVNLTLIASEACAQLDLTDAAANTTSLDEHVAGALFHVMPRVGHVELTCTDVSATIPGTSGLLFTHGIVHVLMRFEGLTGGAVTLAEGGCPTLPTTLPATLVGASTMQLQACSLGALLSNCAANCTRCSDSLASACTACAEGYGLQLLDGQCAVPSSSASASSSSSSSTLILSWVMGTLAVVLLGIILVITYQWRQGRWRTDKAGRPLAGQAEGRTAAQDPATGATDGLLEGALSPLDAMEPTPASTSKGSKRRRRWSRKLPLPRKDGHSAGSGTDSDGELSPNKRVKGRDVTVALSTFDQGLSISSPSKRSVSALRHLASSALQESDAEPVPPSPRSSAGTRTPKSSKSKTKSTGKSSSKKHSVKASVIQPPSPASDAWAAPLAPVDPFPKDSYEF